LGGPVEARLRRWLAEANRKVKEYGGGPHELFEEAFDAAWDEGTRVIQRHEGKPLGDAALEALALLRALMDELWGEVGYEEGLPEIAVLEEYARRLPSR